LNIKIYGAPGTGKTFRSIQYYKDYLKAGITPEEILFTTYRRETANDIAGSIAFETGIPISTIKKAANTMNGIGLSLVIKAGLVNPKSDPILNEFRDIPEFNKKYGYNIKVGGNSEESAAQGKADVVLSTYSLMKATRTSINEIYNLNVAGNVPLPDFKAFVQQFPF
jgi:hypothetical protein